MRGIVRSRPSASGGPARRGSTKQLSRLSVIVIAATGLLASAMAAAATPPTVADAVATFEYTQNMHPLGFSAREVPLSGPTSGSFNSDLAFWGDMAVQGSYAGFRLIDISSPANPVEIINWEECTSATSSAGNQGDIIIYGDLIVRSWNSPTGFSGSSCGDFPMAQGEEGVHMIDISDPTNPVVVGFVDLPCGSHTETGVPDLVNNRLIVYSNPSGGACPQIDIVEVPLDDPGSATYLGPLTSGRPCHDTGVILGDVNKMACAGGNGVTVWSLDAADGGSLTAPAFQFSQSLGVGIGHSAAWTWDGEVLVFGHEPGGGGQAQCQATSSVLNRTLFFLDGDTGETLGTFLHPRPQTNTENCTWHNYTVVPTDKAYVLVSGNYQSGISVLDFTDPSNVREIAYADPAPLSDAGLVIGGDWSTYWYNGFIYESDIRRGLIVWKLSDPAVAGAKKFPYSNPQTQETSFGTSPAFGEGLRG